MRTDDPNGQSLGVSPYMRASDTERLHREADIDDASAQSFPASDPPSSTTVHAGSPSRLGTAGQEEKTVENEVGTQWVQEEHAYSVVTWRGATATPERSGLSHVEAMMFAEEAQRDGKVASVMHVIGDKTYEVDRYPCR